MQSSGGGGDQHCWMGADENQICDNGKIWMKKIPSPGTSLFMLSMPKYKVTVRFLKYQKHVRILRNIYWLWLVC